MDHAVGAKFRKHAGKLRGVTDVASLEHVPAAVAVPIERVFRRGVSQLVEINQAVMGCRKKFVAQRAANETRPSGDQHHSGGTRLIG